MADTPVPVLSYTGSGPDGARREVTLPPAVPRLGDDFNWQARDFDSIRVTMIEELAARFPEHARWTPADLEAVLVEVLAAALDQLSDMADRVTAEAYLDTARRPESVRRLLGFIGYDAATLAGLTDPPANQVGALTKEQQLDALWTQTPSLMEAARRAGPRQTHTQRRMVTLADYTARLEEHPLVTRAAAASHWSGSWTTLQVAVVLPWPATQLDTPWADTPIGGEPERIDAIQRFCRERGLPVPELDNPEATAGLTPRALLAPYVDAYRLVGQEVLLEDAVPVGVEMDLSLEIGPDYFQSELRRAVADALGTQPGGFFEPGRLRFGEDLHLSDLYQLLLALEGVQRATITRFKRAGAQYADFASAGTIVMKGLEVAVCDNQPGQPARGSSRLTLTGGRRG